MSIADKITQLTNIRAAIRTALQNKGIAAAAAHNFSDFAADIAAIATGANLQSKSVSPSTLAQTVTPDSGYDGLSSVEVAAAPLETRTVTPTAAGLQVQKSASRYYGLFRVNVNGDANLAAENIKSGVSIFGVAGSYSPSFQLQSKSVTPTASDQTVVADSGYDGLSQVSVAAAPLETKAVTPSASEQTITPSSGKIGMSQVTVAATPLESKSVTPGASQQTVTPSSGKVGLSSVIVAGDADLIASNIKKDVEVFGVTGTYEGSSEVVNGSLIEITCSSNIDEVTATVNGNTYTANLDTSTHKAYVVIPYTDTTAARTCVLRAYRNGSQLTSSNLSMAKGIGYYTASLSTSQYLYRNGTWYGVSSPTWTKSVNTSTVTDSSSGLVFYCPNGNYNHTFTLSPTFDMRGYSNFEIVYELTGGVHGSAETYPSRGASYVGIYGSGMSNYGAYYNLPDTYSTAIPETTKTSTGGEGTSENATLTVSVSVKMGYAPATLTIKSIKLV